MNQSSEETVVAVQDVFKELDIEYKRKLKIFVAIAAVTALSLLTSSGISNFKSAAVMALFLLSVDLLSIGRSRRICETVQRLFVPQHLSGDETNTQ